VRIRFLLPLLALAACRPADPLAIAWPGDSDPPPLRIAVAGDTVAVQVHQYSVRSIPIIGADGSLDVPMCGKVDAAGLDAPALCAKISECLTRVYRRTAVQVTIGDGSDPAQSSAGCDVEGPPQPQTWDAVSQRALDALSTPLDPGLLERAVEASLQLETLRVEFTDEHPDVAAAQARAAQLVGALVPASEGVDGAMRQRVLSLQSAAEHALAELRVVYADKHPAVRVAQTRARFLVQATGALPLAAPSDRASDQVVSRVETDIRLGLATQRYEDGHPQVVALRAQRAALAEPPDPAPSCEDVLRTFDLRVAFLLGQERAADDSPELEAVIDALAVARAGYRASAACREKSSAAEAPPPRQ